MPLEEQLSNPQNVAALIDQTLLKPDAASGDIARLCQQSLQCRFASVCVNPVWVRFASQQLAGSPVRVCTVIGFPLGANTSETKLAEARSALSHGATELDMVQNIGALRSGDTRLVQQEIAELAALAHSHGAILKVILETCLLTESEKVTACQLALAANADFVKTSTGFSTGNATESDVRLMRETVGPRMGVKASGGIRNLDALRRMAAAGATRIGTSAGVQILTELERSGVPQAEASVSNQPEVY